VAGVLLPVALSGLNSVFAHRVGSENESASPTCRTGLLCKGWWQMSGQQVKRSVRVEVFTAGWSPVSGPLLTHLKQSTGASAPLYTVQVFDCDEEFVRAEANRILTVPTVIVFVDGKERRRFTGVSAVQASVFAQRQALRK
jgi:hypothetical protein